MKARSTKKLVSTNLAFVTKGLLILLTSLFLITPGFQVSIANGELESPAPSVDAVLDDAFDSHEPVFQEGTDEDLPPPNHPPMDQIPPAPMLPCGPCLLCANGALS